ncbi:MAG TPA: hypothetical protein VFT72_05455 [Opitutaceae bacterium]|nr:hypothetical protein [Opitutaceae bacterium]
MNDTGAPFSPDPALTQAPFSQGTRQKGAYSRRPYDVLGLTWIHGSLHAAIFRRQTLKRSWQYPTPVRTLEEFEAALDEAIVTLRFGGTEVFLILEHDRFVHQSEQAPAFSDAAARAYLRGRVELFEKANGPALWISQRTTSTRKEASFLLHLLPSEFYGRINGMLLARRLDLTRILPVVVPLQLALDSLGLEKDTPVLIAADTGDATTVMVARANGELLFSRTMLARWDADPARIGVEVNRSVLYAKQQFGTIVEKLWLLGSAGENARNEVQSRVGAGKQVSIQNSTSVDWMQAIAKLSARHPINLVAGYLGRKRRQQFLRRIAIAACWLTISLLSLDTWTRLAETREERSHLVELRKSEASLREQRDRLTLRNESAQRLRRLIKEAADDRVAPFTIKLLPYLASVIPADAQLLEFNSRWDEATGKWSFHVEGQIEGDEDTNREAMDNVLRQLARGPLRVHMSENSASFVGSTNFGNEGGRATQRFAWEGTLFEN